VKSYWNGSESIVKTFWLLYVFGSIATAICSGLLIWFVGVIIDFPASYSIAFLAFLLLLFLNPFYIYCWVCLWRSSNNAKSIYSNRGVKILVVIHAVYFAYNLGVIPEIYKIYTGAV